MQSDGEQEDWLKGTVAVLSVSLACQVVDLLLVKFARRTYEGRDREVRGTRLRRPLLSLFIVPLIYFILIYYGLRCYGCCMDISKGSYG